MFSLYLTEVYIVLRNSKHTELFQSCCKENALGKAHAEMLVREIEVMHKAEGILVFQKF